jgi:putative Mn2+ efflux pump MntP
VLRLIALIVPLGLDSFAVAAVLGMAGVDRRERVRIGALFGAFEAGMPLVGFAIGAPVGHAVGTAADYAAAAILIGLGAFMLRGDDDAEAARARRLARTRGLAALLLGLSISLDELAIGLALGLLRLPVLPVALLVGAQAVIVSQLGLSLGARLGERLRERAERLAGIAMIALGAVFLLERVIS